ncbi:unnamed protein product [Rotaria socialis]|uniref:Uncharacterized protein n=2 Tax=Rotaria socialis TaxID=392032 RepID=A0A817W0B9_9BILA|nr:unnamed protein product [Rotaria socialis]CAF3346364.1 unnamed protein product [Rotaria socialis]
MSYAKRDPNNPPNYYYNLNKKQQQNWMKTAKKMNKNEDLQAKYPPFKSSSNITIIHIHHKSTIETINDLIILANRTSHYTVDTESERKKINNDALIQIQFLHSTDASTITLIETAHLPNPQTILYTKIKELWSTIFNNNNEVITWGTVENEFNNFHHLDFINLGNPFQHINLQSLFKGWHNEHCVTHPEMEKRDKKTGPVSSNMVDMSGDDSDDDMDDEKLNDYVQYKCDHITHYDYNATWSLQDAIATTFNKFLDKSQTINFWQCGIDLQLDTWKNKLFSRPQYNKHIEQQQRIKMKQYATDDCIAVAELFLCMYPETTTTTTTTTTAAAARNVSINFEDYLSNISEDEIELIALTKPKLKEKEIVNQPNDSPAELIITTTENEINELIPTQKPPPNTSTTLTLTKNERQRRKNRKLKWKQKHRPDFQRKIKRPIYHRYDYRKIRSQLADDDIHTSHQITINKEKGEVLIGLKSKEEEEKARNKIKINYFSREQYKQRWGDEDNCLLCSMIKTPNSLLCRSDEIWCLPMTNATDKIDPNGVCIPHEQNAQWSYSSKCETIISYSKDHGEILLDNSTLSNRESLCLIIIAKERHKMKMKITIN